MALQGTARRYQLLASGIAVAALLTGCASGAEAPPTPADTVAPSSAAPLTLTPEPPPVTPSPPPRPPSSEGRMVQVAEIDGDISPKSVVASGKGLFFAQNMMYRHTVTVYDRSFQLVATIPDTVVLSNFGHTEFQGEFQGAPVEAAFTSDGRYAYVSNYSMYGPGFREGADSCSPASNYPDSFVYRINTSTLQIDQVIRVGAVPKFVAVTPDDKRILVTNWCTYDLSIIDAAASAEIQRIPIGAYPRGLAVSPDSRVAYVAVMGGTSVATVDLTTFEVGAIEGVGGGPRHLNISPDGTQLYVTLNRDGQVAKVDIPTATVVSRVSTGSAPRSMAIADDGQSLYVVNYNSSTVAKVRTSDMAVLQTEGVGYHPIGITHDAQTRQIWVATYGGTLAVFQDGSPG